MLPPALSRPRHRIPVHDAEPRHRPPSRDHGAAARSLHRLPVGRRADLRDDRSLHPRGGLRGRRGDRALRHGGSRRRARRPLAAGGFPRPNGRGARRLRLRQRRRGDHREDDPPPSARVRRRRPDRRRRRQGALERHQGGGKARQGRAPRGHRPRVRRPHLRSRRRAAGDAGPRQGVEAAARRRRPSASTGAPRGR